MTTKASESETARGVTIVRGTVCHVTADPFSQADDLNALETYEDGGLAFDESGRILSLTDFSEARRRYPQAGLIDRSGCLILPGLIDCHIHFPQTLLIGAFGEELLDWLRRHTFPEEIKYRERHYAEQAARIFFQEEIANGTTTALIFGAHFEEATGVAFAEAERRGFRAFMGMTLSDCNLPAELALPAEDAYRACKRLIERWHGKGRLKYVVTPRFALTCSPELLRVCRALTEEHPDVYFQTHLNENHHEIERIKEIFSDADSYLSVYDSFGLLGPRSFFEHCIYSKDKEIDRLAQSHSRVTHCPSSNMFLGSGLIPLKKYVDRQVIVALGSDVAGGTSFSLLKEMGHAYKVQALQMFAMERPDLAVMLTPVKLLYLATLAGARALGMEGQIGNFSCGASADLVVVDPGLDAYFQARLKNVGSTAEKLFLLAVLGDKHLVREVLIGGRTAHSR